MRPTKTTITDLKTQIADLTNRMLADAEQMRFERSEHATTLQLFNECQAELAAAQRFRDDLVDQLTSAWLEERKRSQQHQRTLEYARKILARPGVASRTDVDLQYALADHNPPF